jgi:hypothetical protein
MAQLCTGQQVKSQEKQPCNINQHHSTPPFRRKKEKNRGNYNWSDYRP